MKIRLDIQEKYKEVEIHICSNKKSKEEIEIKNMIEEMFFKKITGYKEQEMYSIKINEIVRIYSESKRVFVRTKDDVYLVRERLYILEENLKESGFVRISNSEIVNISQIQKLDMSLVGTIKMYLKNGDVTYVSRRYVSKIKEVLS